MLDFYCRVAKKLIIFRAYFLLMLVIDFSFVCYALAFTDSAAFELGLFPALLAFLWLLLLQLFCQMFGTAGDLTNPTQGFFSKSKRKLKRFMYGGFALLFSLLSVAVLLLSIRSINIWLQS